MLMISFGIGGGGYVSMEYLSEVVFGGDLDELSMIVLFDRFLRFDGTSSLNLEEFSLSDTIIW